VAVFQTLKSIFLNDSGEARVEPAPATSYRICPLTEKKLREVIRLNRRCFRNGENYTRHTFAYLFNEPNVLSYQIVTENGQMAAFLFVILNPDGTAHLTTIGVAPEHRRRGLAQMLLVHLEKALSEKGVSTIVLEVRVSNLAARRLYEKCGYVAVKTISQYYSDGEDCLLMLRAI
jgi:ribosomal-protein-alanine N-acetyltransferase